MDPFIGEIRVFGFSYAPQNWAMCNGQLLPIRQYPALFSILGLTYGGDGRTTFGLPNLQGRAALQPGQGPGLSPYTQGQTGGVATVTLNQTQMPVHTHTLSAVSDPAESSVPTGNVLARSVGGPIYAPGTASVTLSPAALSAQGSTAAHNNMPPYLVANFCIALQGIFPPRP